MIQYFPFLILTQFHVSIFDMKSREVESLTAGSQETFLLYFHLSIAHLLYLLLFLKVEQLTIPHLFCVFESYL